MNCRRPIRILLALCLLAGCSKPTKGPYVPPVDSVNIIDGWPSWSPDGRYIYFDHEARDTLEFFRYGQYSIWAYDTQIKKCGFLMGPGQFAKANPEGTILAFNWGNSLLFYYFDSRTVRQVTNGIDLSTFDWAPSGKSLILNNGSLLDTLGNIYSNILPTDSSEGGWRGSGDAHWYSDNRVLVVSACHPSDSFRKTGILILDTLGQILDTIVIDESPRAYLGGFSYLSMSPDQLKLVTSYTYVTPDSYSHGDFRQYNLNGNLIRIISPEAGMGQWSPDGSKIVFQKYTFMGHSPYPDLYPDYGRVTPWICNADGNDMHELLGWPQPTPDSTMFGGGYNWITDIYAP
jgi:hypothetical protein